MSDKFLHKKSLGQHFLTSDFIPKKMCDAALVAPGDTVLEIGPGTGALTTELLDRGAIVIAVEADTRAITELQNRFASQCATGQLVIHHQDARSLDVQLLGLQPHHFKVVANIPYYLSGFLFRTLLDTEYQPETLVFLIQKEVAQRIARDPKESLLSLSIKVFGNPAYICTVKRGHFQPPPKIDSAIVAVTDINRSRLTTISSEVFFHILHLGFGQKRKQLLGNLSQEYPRAALETVFTTLGLSLTVRAEDIDIDTWLLLVFHLQSTDS